MDEVARGEVAESQLAGFIERRDKERRKSEGERPEHEAYFESEEAYYARRSRALRWEWVRHYEHLADAAERNGKAIAKANRAKAQALIDELVAEE